MGEGVKQEEGGEGEMLGCFPFPCGLRSGFDGDKGSTMRHLIFLRRGWGFPSLCNVGWLFELELTSSCLVVLGLAFDNVKSDRSALAPTTAGVIILWYG